MFLVATRALLHKPARLAAAAAALGFLFFLTATFCGLLVGWCDTTSAIVRNAGADVWVMAERTPAFDYGTPIPRRRADQVRSAAGVAATDEMFMGWNYWQCPDGKRITVEIVGLDRSNAGGPWEMTAGAAEDVHRPDGVIVDELYAPALGVGRVGDEVEITGRRAVVVGLCKGVRTFTAAPFVFTSVKAARKFDPRYAGDEITYVLVRSRPGWTPEATAAAIRAEVPHVEALTADQFAVRTMRFWMLETGAGISVVLTAVLGLIVGAAVTNQTMYAITQDNLPHYATLMAVGFTKRQLFGCVAHQAVTLGAIGVILGTAGFLVARAASADGQLPLGLDLRLFAGLVAFSLLGSGAGGLASVRTVVKVDPATVFRGG
ncbi:MAG: ABC transporter permease [Gemmataceae bacterium]